MKYLLLDVTTYETKLLLIAPDLSSAQLHGRIARVGGRDIIAPPLEGRGFSKLDKMPLQYLYWTTFREAPSEDYATLLADCARAFETLPVDTTPLRELEAEVARLYPDEPVIRPASKGSPMGQGGNPTQPKSGSTTGRVWAIADSLWQTNGAMPDRKAVMALCETEGINPSTASTQYGKWKASRLEPKKA